MNGSSSTKNYILGWIRIIISAGRGFSWIRIDFTESPREANEVLFNLSILPTALSNYTHAQPSLLLRRWQKNFGFFKWWWARWIKHLTLDSIKGAINFIKGVLKKNFPLKYYYSFLFCLKWQTALSEWTRKSAIFRRINRKAFFSGVTKNSYG